MNHAECPMSCVVDEADRNLSFNVRAGQIWRNGAKRKGLWITVAYIDKKSHGQWKQTFSPNQYDEALAVFEALEQKRVKPQDYLKAC